MSYIEYYNLKEQPFTNTVDTKFYYNSAQHSEALLRLKYAINTMKGLAVLVGRHWHREDHPCPGGCLMSQDREFESALLVIIHSNITPEWLLKKILTQLGCRGYP